MGIFLKFFDKKRFAKKIKKANCESLIGCRVIVRSKDAGVLYGTLISVNLRHVILSNARLIWRWRNKNKGVALNDTAIDGLDNDDYSKVSAFNSRLEVLDACTIIKCEKAAIDCLDNYRVFKNNE